MNQHRLPRMMMRLFAVSCSVLSCSNLYSMLSLEALQNRSEPRAVSSLQMLAAQALVKHSCAGHANHTLRTQLLTSIDHLPDQVCSCIARTIMAAHGQLLHRPVDMATDQKTAPDVVAFSPDTTQIALLYAQQTLSFFDTHTGALTHRQSAARVHGFEWHPHALGYLTVGSTSIVIYDAHARQLTTIAHGISGIPSIGYTKAQWTKCGNVILCTNDYQLKLFDAATGTCLASPSFSCDRCCRQLHNQLLHDPNLEIVQEHERAHSSPTVPGKVYAEAHDDDSCVFACEIANEYTEKLVMTIPMRIKCSWVSPCGTWIVYVGDDRSSQPLVMLVDTLQGAIVATYRLTGCKPEQLHCQWSPRSDLLALSNRKHPITLITLSQPEQIVKINPPSSYRYCTWSPCGRSLAVACNDARVVVFDLVGATCGSGVSGSDALRAVLALAAHTVAAWRGSLEDHAVIEGINDTHLCTKVMQTITTACNPAVLSNDLVCCAGTGT